MSVSTAPLADADLTVYRTFSFMPGRALLAAGPEFQSPALEAQIKDAASRTLVGKGFEQTNDPEQADFVLSFTLGSRDRIQDNSFPTTYRESWRTDAPYTQDSETRQYTEGTLSIDIFDVATRRPVWHGSASKAMDGSARDAQDVLRRAVEAILAEFPSV
jgi:hypothetical protein